MAAGAWIDLLAWCWSGKRGRRIGSFCRCARVAKCLPREQRIFEHCTGWVPEAREQPCGTTAYHNSRIAYLRQFAVIVVSNRCFLSSNATPNNATPTPQPLLRKHPMSTIFVIGYTIKFHLEGSFYSSQFTDTTLGRLPALNNESRIRQNGTNINTRYE